MPASNPTERRMIASIAGLARSSNETGAEMIAAAHKTYRDSFRVRHECALCGLVEIDQELPKEEIERRGQAAFRAHMRRLALKRSQASRHAHEADGLADIASAS